MAWAVPKQSVFNCLQRSLTDGYVHKMLIIASTIFQAGTMGGNSNMLPAVCCLRTAQLLSTLDICPELLSGKYKSSTTGMFKIYLSCKKKLFSACLYSPTEYKMSETISTGDQDFKVFTNNNIDMLSFVHCSKIWHFISKCNQSYGLH